MRWRFSTFEGLLLLLVIAGAGAVYAWVFYGKGALIGATYALFMCLPIIAFERRIIFRRLHRRIHAFSTPVFFVASLVIYFVLLDVGYAAAGLLMQTGGVMKDHWMDAMMPSKTVLVFALGVSGSLVFILRVRELLGRDVFLSLLTGRYRRPIEEERVFLFIDLAGSTAYAEKHGDLRMQEYLGRLFATIADPVMRYRGSIDDYIGDAAVITWPFDRATNNAACIHCVFDILEMIDADATRWQKEFGEVPRLRAALHGGTIVAAEIGLDRHKITYFGDTVNTTARLEGFCKTLGHQVLISTDLARKMRLPHYVRVEDLGEHAVRGRGQKLGVLSLRAGSAAPQLASTAAE
ncbi:adenylate/guanylate cyclase domain-containing protein [Ensifer sp. ENS09]|uniref:adenylate/guanylate cyclase domain-containing protein n=1 Tax=Ensifer sp. ENS09 TaxID=2769263 RepID=UPI001783175B|nr:adenylate/guanylate cyclase domain-containing protein [Ensifer sp. ENS09]MBD9648498.1 adenylate/guanylate cyclase domain-containing protein [Ensifer sp. ENS09]